MARGEGYLQGQKATYVRSQGRTSVYYSPTVQRLHHMSRYYPVVNPTSSECSVLLSILFTEYNVLFVSVRSLVPRLTSSLKDNSECPPTLEYVCTIDKSACPPTLAQVRTKRQKRTSDPEVQFFKNFLLVDPSDPKSKLTLQLIYLSLVNYLNYYSFALIAGKIKVHNMGYLCIILSLPGAYMF